MHVESLRLNKFRYEAKPKLTGVVQDTKFLLQQSREKLVITYVLSSFILLHSDLSSLKTRGERYLCIRYDPLQIVYSL